MSTSSSNASTSTNTGPDYGTTPFADSAAVGRSAATSADAGRSNFRTSVINLDRPGDPSVFGDAVRADAAELMSRYPQGQARSALLPLLHLVQSEQGYVTPDGIAFCSDLLGITKAQVAAVATFYTMYKRHPTGEFLVSVCTNTLCGLLGGDEIFAALKDHLAVGNNETTPDGRITLEHAECLAACDYAPVVTVNYEFYDNQTVGTARNLVSQLQSGERPDPTRGAPLCSFRQTERQIAGIYDDVSLAMDANSSGGPTEVGVRLALELGHTAPSYAVEPARSAQDAELAQPAAPAAAAVSDVSTVAGDVSRPGAPAEQPAPVEAVTVDASADKPAARRRTRARPTPARAGTGPAGETTTDTASPGSAYGPSDHDAPLQTSGSDPAHPAKPAGGEAK